MRIRFVFDPDDQWRDVATVSDTAVALLQLQHLWLYIFFLTYEPEELAPLRNPVDFRSLLYRLVRYDFNIYLATEHIRSHSYDRYNSYLDLVVTRIDHSSPLNVHTTSPLPTPLAISRFRKVLDIIHQLLAIDEIREKARWETEISRQRAIEAALKNTEKTLDLSKKIKNPEDAASIAVSILARVALFDPAPSVLDSFRDKRRDNHAHNKRDDNFD